MIEQDKLSLKNNGLLYLKQKDKEVQVFVKKCFPWSAPNEYLSLRDNKDKEVILVKKMDSLSAGDKNILKHYLEKSDFIFEIIEIYEVKDDHQLREYSVKTNAGERKFQTKLEYWPELTDKGVVLIQDLAGDLYRVSSPKDLDKKSKKILDIYIS